MNLFICIFCSLFQFKLYNSFLHNVIPMSMDKHKHQQMKLFMRAKKNAENIIDFKNMSPHYKAKTTNQELYFKYLNDEKTPIVIGIGPAGSGKTLLACNQAVTSLRKGLIQKIILTRPVVPVEEDIGFLPGNLIHKMDPWTRPIFDILLEFYSQKDIDSMLHSGVIEISPLAFMRGRTFKKSFIIADEMQNSSPNQMLMLTTRIGEDSKLIITGDLQQSDRCIDNGLIHFITKIKSYNNHCSKMNITSPDIRIVEMQNEDIQRNPIVSRLLDIFSFEEQKFQRRIPIPPVPPISKTKNINHSTKINNISSISTNENHVYTPYANLNSDYKMNFQYENDAALIPIHHMNRFINNNNNSNINFYE